MQSAQLHITDPVVSTLLQIGGRVLEVSLGGTIVGEWNRDDTEIQLARLESTVIVKKYTNAIGRVVESGKGEVAEYSIISGDTIEKYNIRVLPLQPYKAGHAFVVIEFRSAKKVGKVTEDQWMLALDASSDGMWDVNIPEQTISFSARWSETFGYRMGEIHTLEEWMNLLHPDDKVQTLKAKDDYFAGNLPSYSSEFRVKCKDGTYKWVISKGTIVARNPDGSPVRFAGTHTDFSAHKLAEEKYYSTAQMLSKLINNLRDGVLVTDEHKTIVFANQIFCDIYKIDEHPSSLIGMEVYKSVAIRMPFYKEPERFYARALEILSRKEMVLGEEWEMTSGKVIARDYIPIVQGKEHKGGIWKFRDITAQKNNEKQLADVRNFYESILNSIAADIVVLDPQHRYSFVNPAAANSKELREWMIGKTDEEYCIFMNKPAGLSERRRQIFYEALEKRSNIQWEEVLASKDGGQEYYLRNHFPVFDAHGNHQMSIGYSLNISERVLAQQQLKTSRDTFASAFNDSGIGMALLTHEGMWLDANAVLCAISGYSKEELKLLSLQDITHPDDWQADLSGMSRMLLRELSTFSVDKRLLSKSGKIVLVSFAMSLVWGGDGLPAFFIVQAIDITEKKEMETELRRKNAELEATERNLLNKVTQLEDLSHIIAHNLRGPAGNIKMLSETLLEQQSRKESGDSDGEDDMFTQEEALGLINESSVSLMDSLATLMQITEIKLNKEIPHNACDISVMVNDICNQLQGIVTEKRADVQQQLNVTTVNYPKAYLENILYNLISNALKYTRKGVRPRIDVSTSMVDGRVQLVVKDNGLGIDMSKYADRVFRLNQVFHQGFESKGIGLYITRTQVESFGGKIELNSKPEEGCEFIVTL